MLTLHTKQFHQVIYMINLRFYQKECVEKLLASLSHGKNPICALPTGAGKGVIIAELCQRLDGRILVITHRRELIEQNESVLLRMGGNDTGVYSAGLNRRESEARVLFAGSASVYRRMNELQSASLFNYVILDECHFGISDQSGNTMTDQIFRACPKAKRIGMSATPYKMGDTPIWGDNASWFDEVGYEASILDLTNQGYLARLVGVQTASAPDLSHVRTRSGDYAIGDLSQASSEEEVVNGACDEILYLAQDRQHILIFCVDRAHAAVVADALRERGCAPEIVLGNTPSEERDDILARFKNGRVRYLINVGVLTTGFDSPNVDCVALLRSTQSKSLLVQMAGRGCRLHTGKSDCLILDAADNLRRHAPLDGLPKVLRSPKLAEVEKVEREKQALQEKERKAKHDAMVARGVDPLAAESPDADVTLQVTKATYMLRQAKKYPDRQNLLVSYRGVTPWGSERRVTQFVLLDYPGRPGLEAGAWFARRGLEKPVESRRALAMAWNAQVPSEIVVRKNDGWDQVTMEHFEEHQGD